MNYFKGKKIWIIGASEGIGREVAIQLANAGAELALSARNNIRLNELEKELLPNNHLSISLDVLDNTSINNAWDNLKSKWDNFDILIYNAGNYVPMPAEKMVLETIEEMIKINLIGPFRILNKVIPQFLNASHGHIVLIGSIAGYGGLPNSFGYGESKAGIIHLAENLNCDLKNKNIKIQIVNPGFVKTRLTEKNTFKMPAIINAAKAAQYIVEGISTKKFEICFPWHISHALKFLGYLPYSLYFKLVSVYKGK